MKKRVLSLVLVVSLIVTIFTTSVLAEGNMQLETSEAGLSMIKQFEGFSQYAYADSKQWTIGYGVACDPSDYPDGITKAEADELLRTSVEIFENSVSRYANQYGISLSQNQFDALVSITYNLGTSWINPSYRFWMMLRNGIENYTDNQIASALGVWCHVGKTISTGLIQRRITETRVFLDGDYAGSSSTNFKYVIFKGNGGTIDTDVMLYRENAPYLEFTNATRDGYYFTGWYTALEGGTQITAGQSVQNHMTVYARWSTSSSVAPQPNPSGPFSDVAADAWYCDYITGLRDAKVISGYSDGTYRPTEHVTVGEALKLILLTAGHGEQQPSDAHWASGYATLAQERGYLALNELSALDAKVSRAVVAKLAVNALNLTMSDCDTVFSDTDDGYIMALYEAGIAEGSLDQATGERMYYPEKEITRAELAKIIWLISKI